MSQLLFIKRFLTPRIDLLSTENLNAWNDTGHLLWDVLDSVQPLDLDEIITAAREYAWDSAEDGIWERVTAERIAYCLLRLVDDGMVAVLQGSSGLAR